MPVRLEIGPKDIEKSQVVLARRDTRTKSSAPVESLVATVTELLGESSSRCSAARSRSARSTRRVRDLR